MIAKFIYCSFVLFSAVECWFLSDVKNYLYYNVVSKSERCDDKWVTADISGLREDLTRLVYGQPFVVAYVLPAISHHWNTLNPKKPLALSFHGWPGCGKNYVSDIIAKNLFKEGTNSEFRHFFSRANFPHDRYIDTYKFNLQKKLKQSVQKCERALFVFDEVDKYPNGLFDAIKPFLDYNDHIDGINFRRATFIFLSNIGEQPIMDQSIMLYQKGQPRKNYKFKEFELVLKKHAFLEQGGMKQTSLVKNHVIDLYVPFLPMEKRHVEQCIEDLLKKHDTHGTDTVKRITTNVLAELAFGPEPYNFFSLTGCKQIESFVLHHIHENHWEDFLHSEF